MTGTTERRLRRLNPYRGINAHLHSRLQAEPGAWESFHTAQIVLLAALIDEVLPAGYVVAPEQSLQIREFHPTTGDPVILSRRRVRRPDVLIRDQGAGAAQPALHPGAERAPDLVLPAIESLEDDHEIYLRALVIRELSSSTPDQPGRPVTALELLSPTNKPGGGGYFQYREKRAELLDSGLVLVEIDYLHESPSPITRLASYPAQESDAFPYTIVVTDPRPDLQTGQMAVYGIRIDEPLPEIAIPLSREDRVPVDFDAACQRTYATFGIFSTTLDYTLPPVNFDRYSPADQARIRQVMERAAAS